MRLIWCCVLWLAAGCSEIPRDPEETLDRVRATGRFEVGLVATGGPRPEAESRFLRSIAAAADARPELHTGASEELLTMLEEGELDLVVGKFHHKTPWGKRVTFIPPLTGRKDAEAGMLVSAAARNGENAWIALVHGEADLLEGAL